MSTDYLNAYEAAKVGARFSEELAGYEFRHYPLDAPVPGDATKSPEKVPLYSLNGLVSKNDHGSKRDLVVGEADRFAKNRLTRIEEALEDSVCIFVGSRLSTSDILTSLAKTKEYRNPRYAIIQSREFGIEPTAARAEIVNLVAKRFLHLGVVPIIIDFPHQAPQLLIEIALKLQQKQQGLDYSTYGERLQQWWDAGIDDFGFGGRRSDMSIKHDSYIRRIQRIWMAKLDEARNNISECLNISVGGEEQLRVDIWLRDPNRNKRRLILWASSDEIMLNPSSAPWCSIPDDVNRQSGKYAVQQAFRSGKPYEDADTRHEVCIPLVLRKHSLPVGVGQVQSNMRDGKLAELHKGKEYAVKLGGLADCINIVVNELLDRDGGLYESIDNQE